jgi:hypothetical protein
LTCQNLTFWGTLEKLHTSGDGNFLKFVEYLALFDPLMEEHRRNISHNETHVYYLGKNNQNELIQLLSNTVKENIATCHASKYFLIVLDCKQYVVHTMGMQT